MKINLLKSDNTETKLIIEGVTPSFVNVLRRTASFEVPVLAIENVYFTKNGSALYDEVVAHRLGLVPLKTDLDTYNFVKGCSCKDKGCAKCQVVLKLSVSEPKMVKSNDLKSQDPAVIPAFSEIPIVELIDDQELEFEAVAVLGKGINHVKWSPGLVYYHNYPKSKIKGNIANVLKNVPKGLFDAKGNIIDVNAYDLCQCYADKSDGAIEITTEDNKFVFTVEPWGQLTAKRMLEESNKIIQDKIKGLKLK